MEMARTASNPRGEHEEKNVVRMAYLKDVCEGGPNELAGVPPDTEGKVVNPAGEAISTITPLVVALNVGGRNWVTNRWNPLVRAQHDPHKVINYYGRKTTALELLQSCTSRYRDFVAADGLRSV